MNPFQSTEQLYQIAHSLFDSLEPAAIEPFTSSNLVIRLVIEQPDGRAKLIWKCVSVAICSIKFGQVKKRCTKHFLVAESRSQAT